MTKIGYLRVSTQEQRPDRQIDGLCLLCDELHVEHVSAVGKARPVYERVIAALAPGDTLVVWDLDRAFRSVVDAVLEAEHLRVRGIMFEIVNLKVDTATPSGMLVYTVMSAFAEFERRMLAQRTREGIAAARQRGACIGRPRKLSDEELHCARERVRQHESVKSVAADYGIAPWTLSRALRQASCDAPAHYAIVDDS